MKKDLRNPLLMAGSALSALTAMATLFAPATSVASPAATEISSASTKEKKKSPAAVQQQPPAAQENVVVTGSRGRSTTVTKSASPIDLLSSSDIMRLGANTNIRDALAALLPSFQTQTVSSGSWDSLVRPAGLRGLGGAHVLVLVNGKRRHNSSLINLTTGNLNNGANPVDLDLIPVSAIERIEVLRDGAAAQYGSDAIAGVINIILKKQKAGGEITAQAGQRYPWNGIVDGQRVEVNANMGFALPHDGFLDFAIQGKQERPTIRSGHATGAFYFPLADGRPDPRDATVNRYVYRGGLPRNQELNVSYNMEFPVTSKVTMYSFSTASWRNAMVGQSFRRPNSNQDIPEIYPDGFTPYYSLSETDYQGALGFKGHFGEWAWDLSSTYGEDRVQNGSKYTLNPSYGPDSPTSFTTFTSVFRQWTNNLDFSRPFKLSNTIDSQLSLGVEHRNEGYTTIAGDPKAYSNGGYYYTSGPLAGTPAAIGAQAAITINPNDQANLWRSNYAIYSDYSINLTKRWYIDLAGRGEFYTDTAGNTGSGKLSTRYDFGHGLALRGTAGNGFRAPSLAQEGFAQSSDQYDCGNGVCAMIASRTVPYNNAIARALGAKPLRPETSRSFSVGMTYNPKRSILVTVDPYLIYLDNRIVQTGYFNGAGVNDIIVANGGQPGTSIRYFTNGVNTRTAGVDFRLMYSLPTPRYGSFTFSVAGNWNKTEITHVNGSPSQLSNLNLTLVDRQAQGYITTSTPRLKFILSLDWIYRKWDINFRETWYDQVSLLADDARSDQHYDPKWIADLDITYKVTPYLKLGAGANNLFNTYPSHNEVKDTAGLNYYSSISPFGMYGGYYYGRASLSW